MQPCRRVLAAFASSLPIQSSPTTSSIFLAAARPSFSALVHKRRRGPSFAQIAMASTTSIRTAPAYSARDHVLCAPRTPVVKLAPGAANIGDVDAEMLVVGVWGAEEKNEDKKEGEEKVGVVPADLEALDKMLGGAIGEAVADAAFTGGPGEKTEVVRVCGGGKVKRIVLFGLGPKRSEDAMVSVGSLGSFVVGKAGSVKACQGAEGSVSVAMVGDGPSAAESDVSCKLAEAVGVAGYVDERYVKDGGLKKKAEKVVGAVKVVGGVDAEGVKRGEAFAAGIITTKEVVSAPANYLNPRTMAEAAEILAKEEGLECKILGRDECRELKMGSFLGVAQGDPCEPQFIHLTYKPAGGAKKKVAIVGKSVCHDTGGYNIKAGAGSMIELMKWDMGGGGTTLGAARTIGQLKPEGVEVHFIMPAVLNLVSAEAYLPGDILTAANGKTIEVLNTDAEGRLCLCDALIYAEKVVGGMDGMIDIATLTGAVIVALGNNMAGMWSPSDGMAKRITDAAAGSEDKMWRMPLPDDLVEGLKSKIADWRNIGTGRGASSSVAALFLKQFVETKEWAHLDIAGTAWSSKDSTATGWGVRTLTKWAEGYGKE